MTVYVLLFGCADILQLITQQTTGLRVPLFKVCIVESFHYGQHILRPAEGRSLVSVPCDLPSFVGHEDEVVITGEL